MQILVSSRRLVALTFALIGALGWVRTTVAQDEAVRTFRIAIVRDSDSEYFDTLVRGFEDELRKLAADRYRFELRDGYNAQGDPSRIPELLQQALGDSTNDLVYTAGLVSTAMAGDLEASARRLPVIGGALEFTDFRANLIEKSGGSARPNYTWISSPLRLQSDLQKLSELAGTTKVFPIIDGYLLDFFEKAFDERVRTIEAELGLQLTMVPRKESIAQTIAALPEGARAVYLPILPTMPFREREQLIAQLTRRGILTFSIRGVLDVEKGALAGLATDNRRAVHRRTAINIHQILSGVPPEGLPVNLPADDRLVINMRTALALGWSPNYDTALSARFLDEEAVQAPAASLSLEEAMKIAAGRNPEVEAARAGAEFERTQTAAIRSGYFPQLNVRGQASSLGATDRINPALTPHHSEQFSLGLELRQLLVSDQLISSIRAQSEVAEASELDFESVRLDTVESTARAFLDVLAAEALYRIEKDNLALVENNLRLARLRQQIGVAERSEIYRWQASQARSRALLIQRDADRRNTRVQLNVLLGAPRTTLWDLEDILLDDREIYFMDAELRPLIQDYASFERFLKFLRAESSQRSPEISAFEKRLTAQGILLAERKRRNFLPQISAVASVDRVMQSAHQVSRDSQNEWTIGIGFSIPLFDGGLRRAEKSQIQAITRELSSRRDQALYLVEQRALAAGYGISASHPGMRLSRRALDSAKLNYAAIEAKYTRGSATILDLLDAQREKLSQEQNAAVAVYMYLKDVLAVQRSIAWFEFQKSAQEKADWINALREFMEKEAR